MKPARFLREETLRNLRADVKKNLDSYRDGTFAHLESDSSLTFESTVQLDAGQLDKLMPPSGANLFEVENCTFALSALPGLTPYDARDERLWAFLSHTKLLAHARLRWPIPTDDEAAVKHINKHFFARDKRQIERDNVLSRLWWMGHLCERVDGITLNEALTAFLHRSDVRANIVERPTISQATNVFRVILKRLSTSLKGKGALFERQPFRQLMVEINSVGGFKLLDCLSEAEIEVVVDDLVKNRLAISAL